mmetsp:Transcript_1573/g.5088  ORF Transcript_1573/g.5088 Transcript_1573/m.5088 type:complete len:261 (+) Transcript_1573:4525-5307(+)
MHAVVAEVLANGAARVGRQELEWGGVGGGGGHDGGVIHRTRVDERLHELGHGGALLADGHIDAEERLGLVALGVDKLLVDDGVDGNGGLAGLAIADDQLALAAADRHQRVDGLQAGLHGLVHRLAGDDARRLDLDALFVDVAGERALAINWLAQAVDDAAAEAVADGDVDDRARTLNGVTLLDAAIVAEDDDTDVVILQVKGHALHARVELHHLAGLHPLQAVHARDTVTDGKHLANLLELHLAAIVEDLRLDDGGELGN